MNVVHRRNPYQILRLASTSSPAEVIRRARELCDETMSRELQAEYRQAAEELRRHPVARACCQFWEPPETEYEAPICEEPSRGNR
jgi:hypothetical protein